MFDCGTRHSGGPLDETWGYEKDWVIGETGMVCDWTGVDENGLDMPNCVKGTCGGHKEFDVLPFTVEVKMFS